MGKQRHLDSITGEGVSGPPSTEKRSARWLWLLSAITNANTGEQSAKSVALLLSVAALGITLLALILLACFKVGIDQYVAQAIAAIGTAVGALAGSSYAAGKVSGAWSAARGAAPPKATPAAATAVPARKPDDKDTGEDA